MLTNKELGEYLKKIRETKNLSLRQVDYLSSVSFSHLSMIENGARKPTALTLKELARVYNTDYIDLYEKAGYIDLAEKERLSEKGETKKETKKDILDEINIGMSREEYSKLTEKQKEQIRNFAEFIKNQDNK